MKGVLGHGSCGLEVVSMWENINVGMVVSVDRRKSNH